MCLIAESCGSRQVRDHGPVPSAQLARSPVYAQPAHKLTDGATWHAAGLVGQLRSSRNVTRMLEHSVAMYRGLETETGQAVDWREVGSLRLACSPDRVLELKRLTTMAKSFGLPMEIISASRAQELFPLMTTTDVMAAAYLATDGYIDPASVTQAIARGARPSFSSHRYEKRGA